MRGIVYIGLGEKYLEMSVKSANSIKAITQECPPIVVFTDSSVDRNINDNISICKIDDSYRKDFSKISNDFNPAFEGAYLKTRLFDLSPFETTLYLDSDILAIQDINSIWDWIGNTISIAPAFSPLTTRVTSPEAIYTFQKLIELNDYQQYNAGVVLFEKNLLTKQLFDCWAYEWSKFRESDNMALTRALSYLKHSVVTLPSKYNEFYPWRNINSVLVHYLSLYKVYL